jgi:hypothetical protein
MDSARKSDELIIVFFTAIFIACCFTLVRHFSGIWLPIHSIDLATYWSGLQLFLTAKNPYNPQAMLLKQQELSSQSTGAMVWNPPILFAILSPFLSLPFFWARLIWTTVTTFSNILCAYLSWRLATVQSALKFPGWLLFALFFCPYFYEMSVEQISSFLNLLLVISIILFKRGRYGFAGAIAGLLIVKPHVFFLVFVWYFLVSVFSKRWIFYFGFFSSIALGSIFAELLHPGINVEWLTRESWPAQIVGSTLPSLVRAAILSRYNSYTHLPQILIPLFGIIAVSLAAYQGYRKGNFDKSLILAIILCPLTAPYGFVFDQSMLMVPIMMITAHAYDRESSKNKRSAVLMGLVVVQLLVIITAGTRVFGMELGWYLLPPLVLLIWIMLGCPTKKMKGGISNL